MGCPTNWYRGLVNAAFHDEIMSTSDLTAAFDAMSARITALEMLLFAHADTCLDRAALRAAIDVYAVGIEAKMNALPVGDRQLDLRRVSLDDMRAAIGESARDGRPH